MKAAELMPPTAPRYNVKLASVDAYASGLVSIAGRACVHIRLGTFSHVVHAESALAMARAIIEQAEYAIKLADAWAKARELAQAEKGKEQAP